MAFTRSATSSSRETVPAATPSTIAIHSLPTVSATPFVSRNRLLDERDVRKFHFDTTTVAETRVEADVVPVALGVAPLTRWVAREVIASQRIEDIDARPWLR
jgi:hypothetical protein